MRASSRSVALPHRSRAAGEQADWHSLSEKTDLHLKGWLADLSRTEIRDDTPTAANLYTDWEKYRLNGAN
jgi:hypothetical protein